jgi:hypothetical protein
MTGSGGIWATSLSISAWVAGSVVGESAEEVRDVRFAGSSFGSAFPEGDVTASDPFGDEDGFVVRAEFFVDSVTLGELVVGELVDGFVFEITFGLVPPTTSSAFGWPGLTSSMTALSFGFEPFLPPFPPLPLGAAGGVAVVDPTISSGVRVLTWGVVGAVPPAVGGAMGAAVAVAGGAVGDAVAGGGVVAGATSVIVTFRVSSLALRERRADRPPVALGADPAAGVGVVAVSVVAKRVSAEVAAVLSVEEATAEADAGAVRVVVPRVGGVGRTGRCAAL